MFNIAVLPKLTKNCVTFYFAKSNLRKMLYIFVRIVQMVAEDQQNM